MAHACSFRGYCYGHIPFVSTECPHVPCMYATGHPESHYLKSGPGAGGPFTTGPAAQSSLTQVTCNCNCCWVFFICSFFRFPHYFLGKKKFHALLTFFFYFQVVKNVCLGKEMCNHTLQNEFGLILFEKYEARKPSCWKYTKSEFQSTTVCSFNRDNDI